MRAALYARVSTHDQQTLGLQAEAMSAYIRDRGWDIVRQVEDVGSGAKERPGREALLKAARRREVDVIVVWRLDRWGRSLPDLVVTLRELTELGVGFVSLTEALDLTTSTGRAMAGMLAVFAEFERRDPARTGPRRDRPGAQGGPSARASADGVAEGRRRSSGSRPSTSATRRSRGGSGSAGRRCDASWPRADDQGAEIDLDRIDD